jgi:hypothetical protein
MWHKLRDQIPAIILTAVLFIAAAAFMVQTVLRRQQAELAPLRAQNESLRAQAEENRRQIAATTTLLKDAIAQTNGGLIQGEGQVEKINNERLTRLAEVIAQRVIPSLPVPKPAGESEAAQNEQIDKVADRLAANIRPALADAIAEQKASAAGVLQDSEKRVQQLNVGLLATQAAAQDALRLSREISALYGDAAKDQGVLMRLFSLPASLMVDAANLNFVNGQRAKTQRDLSVKMEEIEKRLREVQSIASSTAN